VRRLEHIITPEQEGVRADFILRQILHLSGTVIKRVKHLPNGILLDGQPVWPSFPVKAGQTLSVLVGDTEVTGGPAPKEGPLDIVYEDEDLVVINKPAGTPTHPGPTDIYNTIGNYLTDYYKKRDIPFLFRPVNRLDVPTSGLMVVARHAHAHSLMKEQLHTPDFRRRYLAVCDGVPEPRQGVIDAPIAQDENSYLKRMIDPEGAPSRTHYRVLAQREGRSLVSLELETGRTHQIRVHMAHIGCPLTGDFLYGTEDKTVIGRTALHSHRVDLIHPITGERLCFAAPLPEDMTRLFPVAEGAETWYDDEN